MENLKKSEILPILGAIDNYMFSAADTICGWRQGNTTDIPDEGKCFVPGMPVSNRLVVELQSGQMLMLTIQVLPPEFLDDCIPATVHIEDDMPGKLEA